MFGVQGVHDESISYLYAFDDRGYMLNCRSLNKEVLKHVLEYLYPSSSDDLGVLTVCKYWKGIFAEICDFRRSNPAGAAHDTDSTALSNSVITDSITNHTTYDGSESVKPVDTNNTPKPRKSKHKPALPLTEEYFKPRIENVDGKSPQFAARLKLREEERKLEEQQREWKEKKLLNGAKSPLAKIVDLCENDDRHAEGSRMGDDESASTGVDGMSALEAIGDPENCPGMQGFDRKSDVSVTEGNMMINLRKGNTKKQLAAWIDIIQVCGLW